MNGSGVTRRMTRVVDTMAQTTRNNPFDEETLALLSSYLEKIPNPVQLRMWGDPRASHGEREAARLVRALADEFEQISAAAFPRRVNYPYYPVLGVFAADGADEIDCGVRMIGLPAGSQLTSLIAAIQAVSFQGTTLAPKTRIQLSRLKQEIILELISSAEDELGTQMSKPVFGLAAASPFIRSYLIMGDVFPEVMWRYSVNYLPHLVINSRVHIDGAFDEESLLQAMANAIKTGG
jgi:alkyl hydroperoxide reductase subunit AhpF